MKNNNIYDPEIVSNKDTFQTIKDEITCNICMMILDNPKQCNNCQNLFCENCILDWSKKKNICPFKCSNFKIVDSGRIVKNMLSKIQFNCVSCDKEINYDAFIEHSSKCASIKKIKCPICDNSDIPETCIDEYNKKLIQDNKNKYEFEIRRLKDQLSTFENMISKIQSSNNNNNDLLISNKTSSSFGNPQIISNFNNNFMSVTKNGFANDITNNKAEIVDMNMSGVYVSQSKEIGNNSLISILNTNNTEGICVSGPAMVTFKLDKTYFIESVQICGYNGNNYLFPKSNGAGATIFASEDNRIWKKVGVIPVKFDSEIININLSPIIKGQFIRFQSNNPIGIGYLSVNDSYVYNDINGIRQFKPCLDENEMSYSVISTSERYSYNSIFPGSFKPLDLLDSNLEKDKGYCLKSPAYFVIKMKEQTRADCIDIGGYNANSTIWYSENGSGAEISVSNDNINYNKVGKITTGFGKKVKKIKFTNGPSTFHYLKITFKSYLGISYLTIPELTLPFHINSSNRKCIYSSIVLKNPYNIKNSQVGTNKPDDLLDNNSNTGVCSSNPGEIIINLRDETTFDKFEVSGYTGDVKNWASQNGGNSIVEYYNNCNNWIKLCNLPNSLSGSIVTIDVEPCTTKSIRISNKSYLGLGVFKIIDKNANTISIFPVSYECSKVYNESFQVSSISEICTKFSSKGICTRTKGWIIFELPKVLKVSKIECKGFTGNTTGWHPTQGIGADILTSVDKSDWKLVGSLPKTHGSAIINFNVFTSEAKYVKIKNDIGYLGIGYFAVIQDN